MFQGSDRTYADISFERYDRPDVSMLTKENVIVVFTLITLWKDENIGTSARRTYIARLAVRRVVANKCLRQFEGELTLADAVIAGKQQRIRHAALCQEMPECLFDVFVSYKLIEHLFENRGDDLRDASVNFLWRTRRVYHAETLRLAFRDA